MRARLPSAILHADRNGFAEMWYRYPMAVVRVTDALFRAGVVDAMIVSVAWVERGGFSKPSRFG